jgi:hypothetical protein
MKRLKAGPELKMPELKVPTFLVDLYWDLRDRRLLPLVGLVIVAIVAAPFLLGGGSKESSSSAPAEITAVPGEAAGSEASSLTVVEAKPGLREYSKRLAHRKPTDPFHQRFTAPRLGTELGGQSTTTSTSSSSSSSSGSSSASFSSETSETSSKSTSTSSPEPAPSSSPSKEGGAAPGNITLFAFALDVYITHSETRPDGSTTMSEGAVKHRVLPPTSLPGEKAPVVSYMGVDVKDGARALLLVSNDVKSIDGDGKCLVGTDPCQLLELKPGVVETFVYGANEVRYRIKIIKIEPVVTGHTSSGPE